MMLDGGKVSVIPSGGRDLLPHVNSDMLVAVGYYDGKISLHNRNGRELPDNVHTAGSGAGRQYRDASGNRQRDGGAIGSERSGAVYAGTLLLGTAIVAAAFVVGIPALAAYIAAHAWFAAVTTICMLGIIGIPAYNVSLVVMNCLFGTVPGQSGPAAVVADSDLPTVAVQIPTRNEPFDIVKKTILSALAIDYPVGRLHIQILDDSDEGNGEYLRLKEFYDNDPAISRMKALHGDHSVAFVHRGVNKGIRPAI
jgi:hypothetical protein